MELSKINRLLLINQFKILEKLYPDEADSYKIERNILEWGYTYSYKDLFEWISDEMSEEECREVIDILDMHRALHNSLKDIQDNTDVKDLNIEFQGFDGNNESRQLLYAKFYMYDLERYGELRDKAESDLNSHCPMLDKYRNMLKVWNGKSKSHDLTKQDVIEILDCGNRV